MLWGLSLAWTKRSLSTVSLLGWKSLQRFPPYENRGLEVAHYPAGKAEHAAMASQIDQFHIAALPGFETHRSAGRDIQAHTARCAALKGQRIVGLEEVVMRADLDGPVAAVGHAQADRATAGIKLDFAVLDLVFAGDHRCFTPGAIA